MNKKRLLLWLGIPLGIVLLAAAGVVTWVTAAMGPTQAALDAMQGDEAVAVRTMPYGIEFTPADSKPATVAVVFYPGARVEPRSYAPWARDVAESGYLVVIAPAPFNLAVLDPRVAEKAFRAHPEVEGWVVAGHSLGGAMAAQFAYSAEKTDPKLKGLVMLAAYPPDGEDMRKSRLEIGSIYGTNDFGFAKIEASLAHLPDNALVMRILGGNHAQMGSYGPQPGDNAATISAEAQQQAAAGATVQLLGRIH